MEEDDVADVALNGFESVEALACLVGLEPQDLRLMAARADTLYLPPRWKPKASGGQRRIDRPWSHLKRVQRRLGELLAERLESPIAFGVSGRSQLDAARVHVRQRFVGHLDIRDFFPGVKSDLVRTKLEEIAEGEVVELMMALLTFRGRLPVGSPASNAVANLVLADLGRRVAERAGAAGVRVTRFTDDFAVSGPVHRDVEGMIGFIARELSRLGPRVNRRKVFITPNHRPQVVHGIV